MKSKKYSMYLLILVMIVGCRGRAMAALDQSVHSDLEFINKTRYKTLFQQVVYSLSTNAVIYDLKWQCLHLY